LNAGKKAADKLEGAKQEATAFQTEGAEINETFQFLFTRTLPVFHADEEYEVPDVAPEEETQEPAMEPVMEPATEMAEPIAA